MRIGHDSGDVDHLSLQPLGNLLALKHHASPFQLDVSSVRTALPGSAIDRLNTAQNRIHVSPPKLSADLARGCTQAAENNLTDMGGLAVLFCIESSLLVLLR
jgi:hypothetical protein